jgi:hypothetical protein
MGSAGHRKRGMPHWAPPIGWGIPKFPKAVIKKATKFMCRRCLTARQQYSFFPFVSFQYNRLTSFSLLRIGEPIALLCYIYPPKLDRL